MHETQASAGGVARRLVLLLGSPRSGTTWLAKILDSCPDVLYVHEPLQKLHHGPLDDPLRRVRRGEELTPNEHRLLVGELGQMHHDCVLPPFFPKRFRPAPAWLLRASWGLSSSSLTGRSLFRRLFSPPAGRSGQFDLLIKEVDWQSRCDSMVASLKPDRLILLVRHPCAVVCSRLAGLRMGIMHAHDRSAWLARHHRRAEAAGFPVDRVTGMTPWAFYALDWLLQNLGYQQAAQAQGDSRTVLFEHLCEDAAGVTSGLFGWLGWEQTWRTGRFIESSRRGPVGRALSRWLGDRHGYYDLHRDPAEARDGWRSRLSQGQIEEILDVTRSFPCMHWWNGGESPASPSAIRRDAVAPPPGPTSLRPGTA